MCFQSKTRNFASTFVKFSKLSHIQTTSWRHPKVAPHRKAGSAGPFVTPLGQAVVNLLENVFADCHLQENYVMYIFTKEINNYV